MGRKRLDQDSIEQWLFDEGIPITLLEYSGTVGGSSLWKCNDCGHEWEARANSVRGGRHRCPHWRNH